jgi:hypothetical protein
MFTIVSAVPLDLMLVFISDLSCHYATGLE